MGIVYRIDSIRGGGRGKRLFWLIVVDNLRNGNEDATKEKKWGGGLACGGDSPTDKISNDERSGLKKRKFLDE